MEKCPAEVIDYIIDFLHHDVPSLASCSLVCRNWVPSTRSHLFHSIRIAGWGPTKLDAFSRFLISTPHIGRHVRELHVRPGEGPAKVTTSTLSCILKRLSWLRVLDIRCSYCQFDDVLLPLLPSLRRLVLQFVEVDIPPKTFVGILGLCPGLKELDIRKSWWASRIRAPISVEPKAPAMPDLDSLTLGNCRFSSLTNYLGVLRSKIPMSFLTSLDIVCSSPDDVSVVGGLLRDIGPKLLHLQLRLGSLLLQGTSTSPSRHPNNLTCHLITRSLVCTSPIHSAPETSLEKLGITHCTSLRTFKVLTSSCGTVYALLRLVFLILQSITSPAISHISIGFVTMSDDGGCRLLQAILGAIPWAEVEHAMTGYPALKEVAFKLERDLILDGLPVPLDEKTKENILKKFPTLHKRGLLNVF